MIRTEIKKMIQQAIKSHWGIDLELAEIKVDYPPEGFGDYSTNVAMTIAKTAKSDPMEVAEVIADEMTKSLRGRKPEAIPTRSPRSPRKAGLARDDRAVFKEIKVVKPGFINFYLKKEAMQGIVKEIIKMGEKYGSSDLGKKQKVQVEFISANPTGPLTVGNSRGGVIGDVLANVLSKNAWQVTREYYFNDAGGQIDVLGHSVLKDDEAEYKGGYIDELHDSLKGKNYREAGKEAAKVLIEQIKETTKKMGINFDVWFAEGKDLRDKGKVDKIIKWLKEKDLAYEKEGALWFKSTEFGDDKDRVLLRSNGEPTYFAVDCAYHKNKFIDRKFDKVINVWGADHHGDIPRIKGFVKALGYEDRFSIIMHQFVRVLKEGKEVRMSKRAGNYITVEDLLEEIGKDVYRFFMLQYSADTHMNFDLDLAKEQSQKNPVYYVQYAYARICSIFRKYGIAHESTRQSADFHLLVHESELELIKQLIKFPEIVEDVANDYQVHRLPHYTLDLVRQFHKFYEECRVISEDKKMTQARLDLIKAVQIVLKNTLDLMGISAPEKM